ncbi:MAG: acyltransferase family protein [Coriobacteriia bacterium]|nr:acyltransferase family protein [Coriobacteriia bacterium]
MSKRLAYIDYARGFAILAVIFFHVGTTRLAIARAITLPAMALFFAMPGLCAKPEPEKLTLAKVCLWAKRLLLPMLVAYAVCILVDMLRGVFVGYDPWAIPQLALSELAWGSSYLPSWFPGSDYLCQVKTWGLPADGTGTDLMTPMTCHLWFIPVLFVGRIIYTMLRPRLKSTMGCVVAIVVLVLLSGVECLDRPLLNQLPWGLTRAGFAAACMIAGQLAMRKDVFSVRGARGFAAFALCFAVWISLYHVGFMNLSPNMAYWGPTDTLLDPFGAFALSAAMAYAVIYACRSLELWPHLAGVKKWLGTLGKNTLPVYLWHLPIKGLIEVLIIAVTGVTLHFDVFFCLLDPSQNPWLVLAENTVLIVGFSLYLMCVKSRQRAQ